LQDWIKVEIGAGEKLSTLVPEEPRLNAKDIATRREHDKINDTMVISMEEGKSSTKTIPSKAIRKGICFCSKDLFPPNMLTF